jgi:DNA-binding transcriptional LysR family regulator
MNPVHIAAFDLNLLLAFEALAAERNVTRAARRVGLSQSALSHALRRLRAHFGDELFQATPRGMMPTARAQALEGPLAEALRIVRETVESPRPFDPRVLTRHFTLSTADYAELVLLPRLQARLARLAPGVTLTVRPPSTDSARALLSGEHDLTIGLPTEIAADLRAEPLFSERFVTVLRTGHPDAKKRMTLARYVRLSHVLVSPQGSGESMVDAALRAVGRTRHIALRVPHFLIAPLVVAETDYVLTAPARMIRALGTLRPLAVHTPPLEIPGFSMSVLWHVRNDLDPGHQWLRAQIAEVARTI